MRLAVGPSITHAVSASKRERAFLRELLSIKVPKAKYSKLVRSGKWDGVRRFFHRGKSFPAGLLYLVQKYLPDGWRLDVDYKYERLTLREFSPSGFEMKGEWAFQAEAIRRCKYYGSGLVWTATNSGKSVMIATLVGSYLPKPSLVLVHRTEIFGEVYRVIKAAVRVPVGVIRAGEVNVGNKAVVVAMKDTLYSQLLNESERVLDYFDSVRLLIVDECHRARSDTYQFILKRSKASHRFGFSATIPRVNTVDGMIIRGSFGPVLIRVRNEALVESGISAEPVINIVMSLVDLPKLPADVSHFERFRMVERLAIVDNPARNGYIVDLIEQHRGRGMLIVVSVLDHGRAIQRIAAERGVSVEFVSGATRRRELLVNRFLKGRLDVLISSEILDEGINTSRIRVLILAAGRKSERQALQRLGRGMRKKAEDNRLLVYDFDDRGHRYLERHSRQRQKVFKDEGFRLVKVKGVRLYHGQKGEGKGFAYERKTKEGQASDETSGIRGFAVGSARASEDGGGAKAGG